MRYYAIGILLGFVLSLMVRLWCLRADRRGAGVLATAGGAVLWSALEGLCWPCLILRGSAHALMVMAVKINAYRVRRMMDGAAVAHRMEPEAGTRKAA